MTIIKFQQAQQSIKFASKLLIGEQSQLTKFIANLDAEIQRVVQAVVVEGNQSSVSTYANSCHFVVATIPAEKSRNLGHIRSDAISEVLSSSLPKGYESKQTLLTLVLQERAQIEACAAAVARAVPSYSRKSVAKKQEEGTLHVEIVMQDGSKVDYEHLQKLADATRLCASLVDMPASELTTDNYVAKVKTVVSELSTSGTVDLKVIRGEELRDGGFGGLWGVGKAAPFPPALAVLQYTPAKVVGDKCIAMVGKGICFDTGGLSIKGSTNMCQMKSDMGGSAAILGAFQVLAESNHQQRVTALLCIAENSVDSLSTRPDDILTMYSGKTVEINNTDAEGRLVLADGVAYATKDLSPVPTHLIDMATLTGAQMVCTGMKHAALVSNNSEFEQLAVKSGRDSGDLTFPILYCPELLNKEFKSEVADMKNSVKSRMNAQSSCAGHFIESHINAEWKGQWVHVDIAGPSFAGERATGFGVALLVNMAHNIK